MCSEKLGKCSNFQTIRIRKVSCLPNSWKSEKTLHLRRPDEDGLAFRMIPCIRSFKPTPPVENCSINGNSLQSSQLELSWGHAQTQDQADWNLGPVRVPYLVWRAMLLQYTLMKTDDCVVRRNFNYLFLDGWALAMLLWLTAFLTSTITLDA